MGQEFVFLNIDKRQKLEWSRFGELYLNGSPTDLINLLAIPDLAQTTATSEDQDLYVSAFLVDEPLSWAGNRIICIGTSANDWPDDILAADDSKSLETPSFLFNHAPDIIRDHWQPRTRKRTRKPSYPGTAVLRNLSKRLYVRSEGIPSLVGENRTLRYHQDPTLVGELLDGLGYILLCRIGWTASEGMSSTWERSRALSAGEWAGDKFDVRSWEEVQEELESGGWTDITRQEAARFVQIWTEDGWSRFEDDIDDPLVI